MKKNIKKIIAVGNSVEIPVIVNEEKIMLKSSVEGVGDDNKIIITAPLYKLNYYNVRSGDVFRLHIKAKSGIVEFKAKILKRVKVRNILTIVLEAICEPLLIQRREFFRLNILKDVAVDYEDLHFNLITKEMSAGGLSGIAVDVGDIAIGERLTIKLNLGNESINLIGQVMFCKPFEGSIRRYEYRLKYLDVSQAIRTKLLNYIFSEQRNIMKKK